MADGGKQSSLRHLLVTAAEANLCPAICSFASASRCPDGSEEQPSDIRLLRPSDRLERLLTACRGAVTLGALETPIGCQQTPVNQTPAC